MVTHEITLSFSVTPARVRLLLALALCLAFPRQSSTADVSTFDFYYPTPSGYLDRLDIPGLSGSPAAILARDTGEVAIGGTNHSSGFLSVGKDAGPESGFADARMRVYGTMRIDGCLTVKESQKDFANSKWRCRF